MCWCFIDYEITRNSQVPSSAAYSNSPPFSTSTPLPDPGTEPPAYLHQKDETAPSQILSPPRHLPRRKNVASLLLYPSSKPNKNSLIRTSFLKADVTYPGGSCAVTKLDCTTAVVSVHVMSADLSSPADTNALRQFAPPV